jgi:hypothetical protein
MSAQKSTQEPRDAILKMTTTGALLSAPWNANAAQLVFDKDSMSGFYHNASPRRRSLRHSLRSHIQRHLLKVDDDVYL